MGPLAGIRVIEMAGIGPAPFCGMMLADMGADVVRIDRTTGRAGPLEFDARFDVFGRGKRSVPIDLKSQKGLRLALSLIAKADILLEGFRPGVMERLGLGPENCMENNPTLVYGRMTGWGQTGPLSQTAGHDLNYISIAGVLSGIGAKDSTPTVPLNLIGDFGGGGMLLLSGLLAALVERQSSGKGQVIDAAMVEGSSLLQSGLYGLQAAGLWQDGRQQNRLDGGYFYYDTYEASDGAHIAVACLEDQFFDEFLLKLNLSPDDFLDRHLFENQDKYRKKVAAILASNTGDHWQAIFKDSDACVSLILDKTQSREHPHMEVRQAFVTIEGVPQPAPAPKFSRSKAETPKVAPTPGENLEDVLQDWEISET